MHCNCSGLCTFSTRTCSSIVILSQEAPVQRTSIVHTYIRSSIIKFSVPISVNNISCLERAGDTPLQQFIREYTVFSLGLVSFWGNSSPNESGCGSSASSRGLYLKSKAKKVKPARTEIGLFNKDQEVMHTYTV